MQSIKYLFQEDIYIGIPIIFCGTHLSRRIIFEKKYTICYRSEVIRTKKHIKTKIKIS